jgi:hypothetical protein
LNSSPVLCEFRFEKIPCFKKAQSTKKQRSNHKENKKHHKQSYLDNAVTEGIIISERDKKKTENQS